MQSWVPCSFLEESSYLMKAPLCVFHQLCGGRNGLLSDGAGRGAQEIPGTHQSARWSTEGRAPDRGLQVRNTGDTKRGFVNQMTARGNSFPLLGGIMGCCCQESLALTLTNWGLRDRWTITKMVAAVSKIYRLPVNTGIGSCLKMASKNIIVLYNRGDGKSLCL